MKDGFHTALPGQVDAVFALYEKRVQWMNEKGIRQWNENAYLQVFPRAYYAGQQEAGRLYVWTEGEQVLGAAVLLGSSKNPDGQYRPGILVIQFLPVRLCGFQNRGFIESAFLAAC